MTTALDRVPELDSAAVAQRLRSYMGDVKLSRSALALTSGINRTSLADRLDGKVDFTLEDVAAIAKALNKPWVWVLTGEEGQTPPPPPPAHPFHKPQAVEAVRRLQPVVDVIEDRQPDLAGVETEPETVCLGMLHVVTDKPVGYSTRRSVPARLSLLDSHSMAA